jgi:hypothetical protein
MAKRTSKFLETVKARAKAQAGPKPDKWFVRLSRDAQNELLNARQLYQDGELGAEVTTIHDQAMKDFGITASYPTFGRWMRKHG